MKGENVLVNGDLWTVVDVSPAAPLAEMVAALLEDEGIVSMTRGVDAGSDMLTHLGTQTIGTCYVLVPAAEAERALALIAETVTDYEGDDLDALLEILAAGGEVAYLPGDEPEADDVPDDDEGGEESVRSDS